MEENKNSKKSKNEERKKKFLNLQLKMNASINKQI